MKRKAYEKNRSYSSSVKIVRRNHFNQLVCWPAIEPLNTAGGDSINDFIEFFKRNGFRVKYATEFQTLPDEDDRSGETGGRNDVLFYIHDKDIPQFSIWRFQYGMKWWEDVLDNGGGDIIPTKILDKYQYKW